MGKVEIGKDGETPRKSCEFLVDNDQLIYVHEVDQFTNAFVKSATKGSQNPITCRPPSIPSFALTKKQ
jgi:hypothetical protein